VINAIETTTDVNVTDSLFHNNDAADDEEEDNEGEKIAVVGGNSSSIVDSQRQCGKFSKRQISRELFVVNRDGNLCDKSDNDNSGIHVGGGNFELNKGQIQTPMVTSNLGKGGNRRKIHLDSSFGEAVESPRMSEGLASSTPASVSNFTAKNNRSIDEMSTPNSSFHSTRFFNNTTRSSFGGNSSRKSFDCSGGKNNNSISRRNTSSPLCLGDFINNTSGASSSGKQGTATGECGELNLDLIKS
jgi:hypothetical protein